MVLDCPARPPVLREQLLIDLHLPSHIVHRSLGHFADPIVPVAYGLGLALLALTLRLAVSALPR